MSYPMSWFHEDPKYTLQLQVEQDGCNRTLNIIGVGPIICEQLIVKYNIITINDFVDYVIANGFPYDMNIKEETKFVIYARCANNFMH